MIPHSCNHIPIPYNNKNIIHKILGTGKNENSEPDWGKPPDRIRSKSGPVSNPESKKAGSGSGFSGKRVNLKNRFYDKINVLWVHRC
jgi:hypothetical protein